MKLVLGVNDVAYSDPDNNKVTTTGQVAEILEVEYDVMGVFVELYREDLNKAVADKIMGEMDNLLQGRPILGKRSRKMDKIETLFRQYLSSNEWQQQTGHVIQSSEKSISHRFKDVSNRKKKRKTRAAFIDTGLYQRSFRCELK